MEKKRDVEDEKGFDDLQLETDLKLGCSSECAGFVMGISSYTSFLKFLSFHAALLFLFIVIPWYLAYVIINIID